MPTVTSKCPACGKTVKMDDSNTYAVCDECGSRVPRPDAGYEGLSDARRELASGRAADAVKTADRALESDDRDAEAWIVKGLAALSMATDAGCIRGCVPMFREALCSHNDRNAGFASVCGEIAKWYDANTHRLVDEYSEKSDSSCIKRGLLFRDLERELIGLVAAGLVSEDVERAYVRERRAVLNAASDAYFREGMDSLAKSEIINQKVSGTGAILIVMALRDENNRKRYLSEFADTAPGIFAGHFMKACDPASGRGWMGYRDVWNAYVNLLKDMASAIPERNHLSNALKEGSERNLKGAFDELREARPPWSEYKETMLHSMGRASAACAPFPGLEPDNRKFFAEAIGRLESAYKSPGVSLFKKHVDPDGKEIAMFKSHLDDILERL